jgi:hypothetical protein
MRSFLMCYSELSNDWFSGDFGGLVGWVLAGFGADVAELRPLPPVLGATCSVALVGWRPLAGAVEPTGAERGVLCACASTGCAAGETTVGVGAGVAFTAAFVARELGRGRATIALGTAPAVGDPPLSPAGIAGCEDEASVAVAPT